MSSSLPPYEPQPSYLRSLMHDYHQQINAQTDATVADLQQRWIAARAAINADIARLEQQMETAIANGDQITYAWLADAQRLAALKASVEGNIAQFADATRQLVADGQLSALDLGTNAAQDALAATVPPGMSYTFGVPPADVLHAQAGALSPNSPLTALFAQMGPEAAKSAQAALFTSVALGEGPRAAATRLFWNTNLPRQRAEVIARTEILRSWRGAQMENYRANQDVVSGWQWSADFSDRTCFPAGTLIQTRQGPIPIEQVRVGDEALTHSGRYRPVLDVMARDYRGEMVTLWADTHQVTATSDHPFLVEWQGNLDWVEAGCIPLGARVVGQLERFPQERDHRISKLPVEGRVWQPHHAVAQRLQPQRLARILPLGLGCRVPVHAVDLQNGVDAGDVEVRGIAPARDRELLHKVYAQLLQTAARVGFRLRLARVAAIALGRAEATALDVARLQPHLLATRQAHERMRWPATLLRAVAARWAPAKDRATAQAFMQHILGVLPLAVERAVAPRCADVGVELLAADNTDRVNMPRRLVAGARAVNAVGSKRGVLKRLATDGAGTNLTRLGFDACAGVGMLPLVDRVAGPRTVATAPTTRPGIRDVKGSLTFDTNLFHTHIVTKSAHHIQPTGLVYNLEVADDHSYVADGFVVHNCGACIAMDGTIHTLDQDLDDHIMGRCSALPITRPWSDILAGTGADTSDLTETSIASWDSYLHGNGFAADWFDGLAPEVQNSILGPAKAEAYRAGDITLQDLAGVRRDPVWGDSIEEVSLKQLGMDAQDYLAVARANGTDSVVADAEALAQAQAGTPAAMAETLATDAAKEAEQVASEVATEVADASRIGSTPDEAMALAKADAAAGGRGAIVLAETFSDPLTADARLAQMTERMFGRALTRDELAGLVGAPEGSYVVVSGFDSSYDGLQIMLHAPDWNPVEGPWGVSSYDATRYLLSDGHGGLVMTNSSFFISDAYRSQGLGTQIFADEVRQLSELGNVRYIETHAAGEGDGTLLNDPNKSNGYYTWPRFGYVGRIPEDALQTLQDAVAAGDVPASWGRYTTVQQLMRTQDGRDWWKMYGTEVDLRFDLSAGSLSQRTMDAYLREKGLI